MTEVEELIQEMHVLLDTIKNVFGVMEALTERAFAGGLTPEEQIILEALVHATHPLTEG